MKILKRRNWKAFYASVIFTLSFGLFSFEPLNAADISVTVNPTNPFIDFPVTSSGGNYQVDVAANGGDSVVQLYNVASAGTFISASTPNPNTLVNENDDAGGLLGYGSRIIGTAISGPHVIRVTSYSYWGGGSLPTATYTLSYNHFTTAPVATEVYFEPVPVPYLKSSTAGQLHVKNEKLICTSGVYHAGYAFFGETPTNGSDIYKPSNLTYKLFVNGQSQNHLSINSSASAAEWDLSEIATSGTLTCSVTVSLNSLVIEDKSTDNTQGLSSATSNQREELNRAEEDYFVSFSANSKAYQKALVDNRATWRKEITAIRSNFYDTLIRIKSSGESKMIADTSTALKTMITAQRKSAADYAASKPAAIANKDAANKAAIDAKNVAIAKANAAYGSFIESIGYGVLIP